MSWNQPGSSRKQAVVYPGDSTLLCPLSSLLYSPPLSTGPSPTLGQSLSSSGVNTASHSSHAHVMQYPSSSSGCTHALHSLNLHPDYKQITQKSDIYLNSIDDKIKVVWFR